MNLDDIAVPSNFAALTAILRSMMPPECTQRDGHPGRTIALDLADEYDAIVVGADSERDALRAWWTRFVAYVKARGGHQIIWGTKPYIERQPQPETGTGTGRYEVAARLFIAKTPAPEVTW
jgi:hypothetical protein